jgi:hypothetical protein
MTEQVLNKEGHYIALNNISDELDGGLVALRHGQHDRYKTKLQSALVSIQVLLQQKVVP